jgi:hypothetical protein
MILMSHVVQEMTMWLWTVLMEGNWPISIQFEFPSFTEITRSIRVVERSYLSVCPYHVTLELLKEYWLNLVLDIQTLQTLLNEVHLGRMGPMQHTLYTKLKFVVLSCERNDSHKNLVQGKVHDSACRSTDNVSLKHFQLKKILIWCWPHF